MIDTSTLVTFDEIYKAYVDCCKHKKNKYGTKKFECRAFYNIQNIVSDINNRTYKLMPSQCFIVKDPKPREVFCAHFRDRVVQHFIFNELNPVVEKMLIYDAANCRKYKGTDFAIDRVFKFIRRESDNYKEDVYFLRADLRGFFMAIDRSILLNKVYWIIDNKYKGRHADTLKYLTKLLITADYTKNAIKRSPDIMWELIPPRKTLFGNKNGLPIGNITSQLFSNIYLNDLDHLIKSKHKHYSRYVDDIVIVDKDKIKLKETLQSVRNYLPSINMSLNNNKTYVTDKKIEYLGVNIYEYYKILGKRRINRVYFKGRSYKSRDEFIRKCGSRYGMFKRYHGVNIEKRWAESLDESLTCDTFISDNGRLVYFKLKEKDLFKLLYL